MSTDAGIRDRIIDAALALAAERGWRGLALADVADAAGLPLADVAGLYRDKGAILAGLARRADRAVLAGTEREDRDQPARNRLLDVLMRRLDSLRPCRDGLRAVRRDSPTTAAASLMRSMAAMLEAAGIPADGARGTVRAAGLAAIYLSTLRVWLDDEDDGAALAHCARQLDRADRLVSACRRCGSRPVGETPGREPPDQAPEESAASNAV